MKDLPVRKNIRLKDYDYSSRGYYFITICTRKREILFGEIEDNIMMLNEIGMITKCNMEAIPDHVQGVLIDKYVVMPDHVHMILVVNGVGTRYIASVDAQMEQRTPCMASLQAKSKQTVSRTIQQFKASVSRDTGFTGLWQPRFTDRIIRDENEYRRIWQYIDENPARWAEDEYYSG